VTWEQDSAWEARWWGACINTYAEEAKQIIYAPRMGLQWENLDGTSPYQINLQGRSVLDIGGGPVSLLLKCHNRGRAVVVDPCEYPAWVRSKYEHVGIEMMAVMAENLGEIGIFDEVWIYNVLQHVREPAQVVTQARQHGRILRAFDWLEVPVGAGHPHYLTEEMLNRLYGGEGKVEMLSGLCAGKAYYGIFVGGK